MIPHAKLPTKFGNATIYWFTEWTKEHCALVFWEVENKSAVLCRVHSSCITWDVFSSCKCDCWEQLEKSLEMISEQWGICIYLNQEWRDIGLINKIKAYALQDEWSDTVEANKKLGLPIDNRKYEIVKDIIDGLGITSINLISNNPTKLQKIRDVGVEVAWSTPMIIWANKYSEWYLETKKNKMWHSL